MNLNNDKKDLVIFDNCTATLDLSEFKAFSNATVLRTTDIGLPHNAKDRDILDKIVTLSQSGEYRTANLFTQDKGRDGDTTFTTPHAGVAIIYSTNKNLHEKIKKWKINDLKSISSHYVKLFMDNNVIKIKKDKY